MRRSERPARDKRLSVRSEPVSHAPLTRSLSLTPPSLQDGNGVPASRTGMSKCAFRGSDDATTFPFHVPANAMAVVELRNGADMIEDIGGSDDLVKQMRDLAKEIDDGINKVRKGESDEQSAV